MTPRETLLDWDEIAICGNCSRPIKVGQPYMPRIPFIGSWGGFIHRYWPPQLVLGVQP